MKNSKYPKVLVLGAGNHGKDEFTSLLCNETKLTFTSSSWFLAEIIFEQFGGYAVYPSIKACYEDRRNRRDEWFNFVCAYNQGDLSRLAREILKVSDIYVGLRSLKEFEEAKYLFDYIFYIDASERIKEKDSTLQIPYDSKSMLKIDNNSDLDNLKNQAKIAADIITGRAYVCK
jgi:hypothetical protein